MTEIVKIKQLTLGVQAPIKAHPEDAGIDLRASHAVAIYPGESAVVKTGYAFQIPEGHYGQIAGRSGLAAKAQIIAHPGVVDSNYRGEMMVILHNTHKNSTFLIDVNDRIAQIVIHKLPDIQLEEVEELDDSSRGEDGMGSTGVK